MIRFGIAGKIRSGKTTVTNILGEKITESSGGYVKMEFSDALREVTNILYPETANEKNREKLISVGQHMRKLDKDIWVNIIERKIKQVESDFGEEMPIIVSSVRQPNEIEMLRKNGFKIIQVVADEDKRINRSILSGDKFDKSSFNDYTETALDNATFDYVIKNNKDLDYLKKCVSDIVSLEEYGAGK